MRGKLTIVVFLGCWGLAAYAQGPQQIFDQANQLYQQNRFADARAAYESLLQKGYVSGELYYNLGNAYYKSGDLARAILFYERALKLLPNDDDLRHNLQLANLLITDKIEPIPRLFIWDYWDSLKQVFSLRGVTWLAYVFFILVIGSVAIVILARTYRTRKIALVNATASSIVFLLILVVLMARIADLTRRDQAIVTANITTVKNSPDAKSSDAFVLHAGVKVQITDRLSDWVKIRLADGKVGWMESSAAEVM